EAGNSRTTRYALLVAGATGGFGNGERANPLHLAELAIAARIDVLTNERRELNPAWLQRVATTHNAWQRLRRLMRNVVSVRTDRELNGLYVVVDVPHTDVPVLLTQERARFLRSGAHLGA